jgi:hypothetical protein
MPRYLALLGMALLAAAICSAEINIPHAGEAHFAPDATAERLMKEQQQADPVMDFLEDLMEQPAEEEALVEVLPQQPHLHMPKMPPSATEADHQVDPHAERLVKDAQAEDPVLSFMEAQMAASDGSNMFGGREIDPETGLAKALKEHQDSEDIHERQKQKDAATQAGLRQIQADQNAVAMEQAAIEKAQQDKDSVPAPRSRRWTVWLPSLLTSSPTSHEPPPPPHQRMRRQRMRRQRTRRPRTRTRRLTRTRRKTWRRNSGMRH